MFIQARIEPIDIFPWFEIIFDNLEATIELPTLLYNPDGGEGSWTPIAGGPEGRMLHTATLLADGRRVLVAGGFTAEVYKDDKGQLALQLIPLSSCALYDPGTGWKSLPPLHHRRGGHSATLLQDGTGRVLVAGGQTKDDPLPTKPPYSLELARSYEIYDPATDKWTCPTDDHPNDPTKRLQVPRTLHTATWLTAGPNANKVLVAGGADNYCEFYDPSKNAWGLTSDLNYPRSWHTATLLTAKPNVGKVLVVGGGPNRCEIYQPLGLQLPVGVSAPMKWLLPRN